MELHKNAQVKMLLLYHEGKQFYTGEMPMTSDNQDKPESRKLDLTCLAAFRETFEHY